MWALSTAAQGPAPLRQLDEDTPMPPSFPAAIALTFALAFVAACTEPPPYDLRRIPIDGRPGETLEAGGVARTGRKLGGDRESVELTRLATGAMKIHVAASGDAAYGGGAEVALRETGWRSWIGLGLERHCSLRWGEPGTPVDAPWQTCRFDLPRALTSARLEITRRGTAGGEIFVSDVQIEGSAARRLPNLFILLLDAVRFDGLRPFRAEAGIGQHFEALAKDSVTLRNLHSSSSWTRPAVATLFTGLRAARHRVLDRGDVLAQEALTLGEVLHERGYSTAAWSTNPNVLPVWGLAQGFDVFVDQGSQSWVWGKTDGAEVVSSLRSALASRGREPLFYYAHFMDPHAPYRPSAEMRERIEALPGIKSSFPRPLAILSAVEDWKAFLDYTGELLDTDDHVGAFVQLLKEQNLYDDALILVVSDHGEEFIDHGGRDHGRTLYEELLHVPALVKLPKNRLGGSVVEDSISYPDLMPTLLHELGADLPPGLDGEVIDFEGKTPKPMRPQVALLRLDGRHQSAILDPPWKLIRNDTTGGRELYNLKDDPRERKNMVLWHPETVDKMAQALDLVMSSGQEGWHLLLCGALVEATLDLVLKPSAGTVKPFGFQETEALALPDEPGAWRLRPTLTPVRVERPAFGKIAEVDVPEQVEVLVPPVSESPSIEIRHEGGDEFDYRIGQSGESRTSAKLVLTPLSEGVMAAHGARMECTTGTRPGTATAAAVRPFLRVWYVPPSNKVATETLDPVMRERLRALGYLQ